MPESEVRRVSEVLEAPLARFEESREELVRDIAILESVISSALRRELRDTDARMMLGAVERLGAVFRTVQTAAIEELQRSRSDELAALVNTDQLTGLYNVHYLRAHLNHLVDAQERYGHGFALLLIDIDDLKHINTSLGHAAGDQALVRVATAIRETIRIVDVAGRLGSDEFCILTPYQSTAQAKILGHRLAQAVADLRAKDAPPIAVSVGVAGCPEHGTGSDRLLELADVAMFRAKASGERVVAAEVDADELEADEAGGAA